MQCVCDELGISETDMTLAVSGKMFKMLAFDPPVIWSIASGTAVTVNTPKSKYCV